MTGGNDPALRQRVDYIQEPSERSESDDEDTVREFDAMAGTPFSTAGCTIAVQAT